MPSDSRVVQDNDERSFLPEWINRTSSRKQKLDLARKVLFSDQSDLQSHFEEAVVSGDGDLTEWIALYALPESS